MKVSINQYINEFKRQSNVKTYKGTNKKHAFKVYNAHQRQKGIIDKKEEKNLNSLNVG